MVPHRWKNGILDVESDTTANIETDHFPRVIQCKFKLKQIRKGQMTANKRYEPLPEQKFEEYNEELGREIRKCTKPIGYNKMCEILLSVAPNHFKEITRERKKQDWSDSTEQLFQKRQEARNERDWTLATALHKQFRKNLKYDKTQQLARAFMRI